MEWILASASPRRKQLLNGVLPAFEIIPSISEEKAPDLPPEELVCYLARQKATEIAALKNAQGKAVIGADTIVAIDGEVLGKPKDKADAIRMLNALKGKTHQVYTGVCIVLPNGIKSFFESTDVVFENLTDAFIEKYVDGGSPMDKAGAYGIQDGGLVKEIKGSYSNVVGFPVERFIKELAELKEQGQVTD